MGSLLYFLGLLTCCGGHAVDPNLTFYASFASTINANYSLGSATGTAANGAAISGGHLSLVGAGREVSWAGAGNADAGIQAGTIRLKFTPQYSGSPATWQVLFVTNLNGTNGTANQIDIQHLPSGNLYFAVYDSSHTLVANVQSSAWSPVSGTTYELELDYDLTGTSRLFLDGVQKASVATVGTRDANIGKILVGNFISNDFTDNFFVNELSIFKVVKHTAGYSAPSAAPYP